MTAIDEPIPEVAWLRRPEEVPIRECGDPVVLVRPGDGIHVAPAYHHRGIPSAADEIRIRARVLDRLREVSASLPDGIDLVLWDALRTLETQYDLVEHFRSTLPAGWSERKRQETVERYLAPGPASEEEFRADPPPHSTGGAVDLTLCDAETGAPLSLGAEFDQFDQTSWLRHFEDTEGEVRTLRRTLYRAMLSHGFSPYPWEYWHYELDTPVHAAYYGLPHARYGAAVQWPGSR